jgi:protein-L-isoaspartate(D-aspartate) O-methyltransferase
MSPAEPWRLSARRLAHELAARGIGDPRVLDRIASVPRQVFVPEQLQDSAWLDTALGIGHGQTISQPYIVALMTEAARLQRTDRVLEIGTGSGYQAAVLSGLCGRITSIERIDPLARAAGQRLRDLGLDNIDVLVGDGTLGWADGAPYDAILVTAGAPAVPERLLEQLAEGGRLVLPVGPEDGQVLLAYERHGDQYRSRKLCDCRFVKLIGQAGWRPAYDDGESPDFSRAGD